MKKLIFLLPVLTVALAFFLPEYLLTRQSKAGQEEVKTVSENEYRANYYSLAQKASEGLSREQKVRLATGSWESDIIKIEEKEMKINSMEAVKLVRTYLQQCYKEGKIGINIGQGNQWYYPTVRAYKAEDTTFHTYTAKFYVIHFEKYTGSEYFDVKILEDGYIFFTSL